MIKRATGDWLIKDYLNQDVDLTSTSERRHRHRVQRGLSLRPDARRMQTLLAAESKWQNTTRHRRRSKDDTYTIDEALAAAKPGDTVSLEESYTESREQPAVISTPGITLKGNRNHLLLSLIVKADDVTLDSVEVFGIYTRQGKKVEAVKNLRLDNCRARYFSTGSGDEVILDNCCLNLDGGYRSRITARHCTIVEGSTLIGFLHSGTITLENCILSSPDVVFRSGVPGPKEASFRNCMLHSSDGARFRWYEKMESGFGNPDNRFVDRPLSDLGAVGFETTDCKLDVDPRFVKPSREFRLHDCNLQPGSPARGAASDGKDLGAIPDADGWPLKRLDTESHASTQVGTILRVTVDGEGDTYTIDEALAAAKPGDTVSLEESYTESREQLAVITTPGITLKGNRNRLRSGLKIDADNVTIDSLEAYSFVTKRTDLEIQPVTGLRLVNCRAMFFRPDTGTEAILENCCFTLTGGYQCRITAKHCTFNPGDSASNGINEWYPETTYALENCIVAGADVVFRSGGAGPKQFAFQNCLLFAKGGSRFRWYEGESGFGAAGSQFIDRPFSELGIAGFKSPDSVFDVDPRFVKPDGDFAVRDFTLNPGSPARGAASDGKDLGAIPDADGWPLRRRE